MTRAEKDKFTYTDPREVILVSETKSTARKPAAKKTTAKRPPRARKPAVKMSPAVRDLGAKVVAVATEAALSSESLGVKGHSAGELPGARSGFQARIVLEDGTKIRVQVVVS